MVLAVTVPTIAKTPRANFLNISVTAPQAVPVWAIWRPYAGALGDGREQQYRLRNRHHWTSNPDSVRRWQDPAARDTVRMTTPAEFTVDMMAGPIVVMSAGRDSVRVAAQLAPWRAPIVASWGHLFEISSDGITPQIDRRR
jgi:hypothetical protein